MKSKKKYIIIANRCTHSKDSDDKFFMANLDMLRYIDLEAPTTIKNDHTSLHWYVYDDNVEKSRKRFKQHGIYKVLIEENIFTGKYGPYSMSFIVDNSEIEIENQLLQEFLDEYKKPIVIEDEELGTLIAENSEAGLKGNVIWNNKNVKISLPDSQAIEKMKEMLLNSKSWDTKFKHAMTEEYYEDAKAYFDEEEQNMTKEEFAQSFILEMIYVSNLGVFRASFNSEKFLPDHTIEISGSFDEGIIEILLEG